MDRAGRLVIVCGLPGSGKTTVARRVEREQAGVRLSPDDWMEALGVDLFDQEARARIERVQWELAQRLLQLGQVVVIEWGTWGRDERATLRDGARALGAAVELRFLDAPVDELWARVDARGRELQVSGRALTRADIESYDAMIERPDAAELARYDPPLD